MARGMQIDKFSKKFVKLTAKQKKEAKKEHKKFIRSQYKKTDLNPLSNRYRGYIG